MMDIPKSTRLLSGDKIQDTSVSFQRMMMYLWLKGRHVMKSSQLAGMVTGLGAAEEGEVNEINPTNIPLLLRSGV